MNLDTIRGVLAGVILGDCLGSPTEFRGHSLKYSRKLVNPVKLPRRFQKPIIYPPGSWTDDTEMTIMIGNNIIENKGNYSKDQSVMNYLEWCNSEMKMLGRNTRTLFLGIKTRRGYDTRYAKLDKESTQSNGALMRCSLLTLCNNDSWMIDDCSITNPSTVAIDTNLTYARVLRALAKGEKDTKSIISSLKPETTEVHNVVIDAVNGNKRDLSKNKGWCLNSLWIALYTLYNIQKFPTYSDAIEFVVKDHPGSDSDTNAAITGALLGAYFGYQNIIKTEKENFEIVLNLDFGRPEKYSPTQFFELTENLHKYLKE